MSKRIHSVSETNDRILLRRCKYCNTVFVGKTRLEVNSPYEEHLIEMHKS